MGGTGNGRLDGKVAIITGAARGIGRSTAVLFAREGAAVMGIDVAGPVSSATIDGRARDGGRARRDGPARRGRGRPLARRGRPTSATSAPCAPRPRRPSQAFGGVDILFANAGIQDFKPLLEMDDADWHDQIDVNLNGTANALRAVAPHIVRRGGGRIVLTSSTQGQHGTKYGASYSASKWGILGLMKSAALELGQHGITVNAVVPGLIDTPLTRHRSRYAQAVGDLHSDRPTEELEAEAKRQLAKKSPLGVPWISPDDIAPIVLFLASDEARMVSGAAYDATGGDSANNVA